MRSFSLQSSEQILTQRRRGAEAQRKGRNKDMQDRKRQDKQDNRAKIKEFFFSIFLFLFYYPVYPAACDPAYPCSSLFSAPLRLCASALKFVILASSRFLSEVCSAPLRLNWFGKLVLSSFCFVSFLSAATPQEEAKQAFLLYREGEAAVDPKQRREAFNEALKIYSKLSENSCSGTVLYNLANSYFQLGEYPWAILYYERAARILPREGLIPLNLAIAQGKLGITPLDGPSWMALSLKERWVLLSFFVITLYVVLSALLFFRWKFLRRTSYILGFFLFITLFSIGWSWYVEPLRAVIVEKNPAFPVGTTVKVVREQEGFVEVKYGEKKGVVTSQQLRLVL